MTESPVEPAQNPPPLTVAASLVAVEGIVLVFLAVLEFSSVASERLALGLSTAGFLLAYGVVLLAGGWGLSRRSTWSRGPVLLTQLIAFGLAWNLREHAPVAIGLVLVGAVVLAGLLHPDTLEALDGDTTVPRS
ncbi:MAG: hypothetical protein NTX33_11430 [Propionibacteriales bacterium]|nr:hypothetical protein [Propionibacteriales bacterium]